MTLSDYISSENVEQKLDVEKAVNRLGHIDRAVLHLWVEGYTQEEIASIFGFSQSKICRLLANLHKCA